MAEQLSNRIGVEMAGVRNTNDAQHVSNELHQAVYGMSLDESLATNYAAACGDRHGKCA